MTNVMSATFLFYVVIVYSTRTFPSGVLLRMITFQSEAIIDWLIIYCFTSLSFKNFSLIWRRHQCRWRATKFRPMLGAQGLWAGRDLYRVTPAMIRGLGFPSLIRSTAHSVASYEQKGMSNPDPYWFYEYLFTYISHINLVNRGDSYWDGIHHMVKV
jgi:hypothetical protein